MQGASVKQTRSVCSEWARTPAGGRSRCGFAKRTRGFSAQSISPIWMRCSSNFSWPCPAPTQAPNRGESNSMQGAGVKKTSQQRRWDALSQWRPRRKARPGTAFRLGRSFRMAPQAETATRNRAVEWDMLSQWQLKRKVHPGILVRNGMQFPNEWLAESSSRNPRSERDALSQRRSKRKAHPGIPPQTGTHFPLHLPPRKTCALAIPKLGRRKPKRNRRRSI